MHLARRIGTGASAELSEAAAWRQHAGIAVDGADGRAGADEVGGVQHIEGFDAELGAVTLIGKREFLVGRKIELTEGRPAKIVASRAAEELRAGRSKYPGLREVSVERSVGLGDCFTVDRVWRSGDIWTQCIGRTGGGDNLIGAGRVGKVDGNTAGHDIDARQLPAAEQLLLPAGSVRSKPLTAAIGNIGDGRGGVIERLVVSGGAAISLRIGDIDERAVSVLRFQIGGRVVDAVRPGERVDEEDAVCEPALQLGLQRVVVEEAEVGFSQNIGVLSRVRCATSIPAGKSSQL